MHSQASSETVKAIFLGSGVRKPTLKSLMLDMNKIDLRRLVMKLPKSYNIFKSTNILCSVLLALGSLVLFACNSDQGQKYSRDPVDATAYGKVQEDAYSTLLEKYVDPDRLVRYSLWRSSDQDIVTLKSILSAMALADTKTMPSDEKKAFYINAYNAMTLDLILSHYDETLGGTGSPYPTERSIKNIGSLNDKVWDFYKWKISGQSVSLNDVENKILRPMGDARIHFSIVCASKGCPPILNRSFNAQNINQLLDQLSDNFVNSGRNTKIDIEKNEVRTSHILDWFAQDFINTFGSVKNFIAKFNRTATPDQIQGMKIRYDAYDWLLNESAQVISESEETPTPPPATTPETGSGTEEPPPGSGTEEPTPTPEPGSGTEAPPALSN